MDATLQLFECAHYFCERCSLTLFGEARKARCPRCRSEVRADRVFRGAASSARGPQAAALAWEQPQYVHVRVLGDWMSKIEGLIRRLVHFCVERPDVKHLVCSWLQRALCFFNMPSRCSGPKSSRSCKLALPVAGQRVVHAHVVSGRQSRYTYRVKHSQASARMPCCRSMCHLARSPLCFRTLWQSHACHSHQSKV